MNINIKCTDHPRYAAKKSPRGNCEACWFLYFLKTEGGYVFDRDISEVRNAKNMVCICKTHGRSDNPKCPAHAE